MHLRKQLLVAVISGMLLLILSACGQEQMNPTVIGVEAEDQQDTKPTAAVTREDDTSESGKYTPWSPDGSAKVTYDYVQKSPPAWEMSVHVEIPVEIQDDPTKPTGPWIVSGSKVGVLYATAFGEGAQGLCTVKCDFTGTYWVDGELARLDSPPRECGFKLNLSAKFDPNKVARSGTCPSMIVQQFGCEVLLIFPDNTGGNPWLYNRGSPAMLVKKPNKDAEEKVTLADVELPGDIDCVDWEIP